MGTNFLVITYAIVWLGLMAYLGWIVLRMRGVRADVESARELLGERERERPQS
ncbi:MAG TPA: hypothetical protein VFN78_11735 [Ktedonobacterales bacterium]|nr:hypothetical protein [Ktedonobacterales bacterium]